MFEECHPVSAEKIIKMVTRNAYFIVFWIVYIKWQICVLYRLRTALFYSFFEYGIMLLLKKCIS